MAGSNFQERINRQGREYIASIQATARALWIRACQHDGIPPESSFVVFSDGNPYEKFYQIAMREYLAACREYEAGGYVGLSMRRRN